MENPQHNPRSPLSILHLVAPAAAGGIESVVRSLALGHSERGHAVRVAAVVSDATAPHPWIDTLRDGGIEVLPVGVAGRRYARERQAITELCERLRPQVVHSHGYRSDVVGAAAARALGLPTITTVHGFTGGSWKNRTYERMQCRSLRGFDAVVAVSTALASRLSTAGVHRERIHILPNAFGRLTPFVPSQDARETLGVTADAFHIGWIGRLGREKGADVLLEAISRIAERSFVVSVIGDGRERRALESLAAQRGLGDRVKFHGLVREAARLMPAFDLFVLSSRTEGTPIVLFEAMAAGVPVIATRVGGVPDVLGDEHALLVPPEQPDLLASAIAAVLRGGAGAARRASRARERLASRYALAPWLERYEAIYRGAQRGSAAA